MRRSTGYRGMGSRAGLQHGRDDPAVPGGSLEGVRHLEQRPVGPAAADQLEPDRQAAGVHPAGTEIAGSPVTEVR